MSATKNRVTRAVLPLSGRGTELLPATLAVPKDLLPVGGLPMIMHVLSEAAEAGVREVALVLGPDREGLRRLLLDPLDGEVEGERALTSLKRLRERIRFHTLNAPPSPGLAWSLEAAREFIGQEPFQLLRPDALSFGRQRAAEALAARHAETGRDLLAVTVVTASMAAHIGHHGRLQVKTQGPTAMAITKVFPQGKGSFPLKDGAAGMRWCGRAILGADIFAAFDEARPRTGQPYTLEMLLAARLARGPLEGLLYQGLAFDAGHPQGYQRANLHATTWD